MHATAALLLPLILPAALEEVTFSNGGVTLAGSLLVPAGEGPFPGAVLVHGSGESDRSNAWTSAYTEALVGRGVAVLHPDKRGSGTSGGEWVSAGFPALAGDALAALEVLRAHPRVDATNVGLIGFSQGGHVVPAAAARSARVAFAVSVSGSTVPIVEQVGDEIAMMGERAGLGAEALATLDAVHRAGVRWALDGEGWDDYAAALTAAKAGPLGGSDVALGFPTEREDPAWTFARAVGDFDPMEHWRALRIPVLFVYGGRDTQVRTAKSVARIQEELAPLGVEAGVLWFAGNGHALFREDALDFLASWIRRRGEG